MSSQDCGSEPKLHSHLDTMPSAGLQGTPHPSRKVLPTYSVSHLNVTTCCCPRESPWQVFPSSHVLLRRESEALQVRTARCAHHSRPMHPSAETARHNDQEDRRRHKTIWFKSQLLNHFLARQPLCASVFSWRY